MQLEDYLAQEEQAVIRHEYLGGEIKAMAYASPAHELIVANLITLLNICLAESVCKVYGSNRMVYVPQCDRVYYPDITVVCEQEEFKIFGKKMQANLNPSIIIEILSDSTENIDSIDKWRCYKKIVSLKTYVLVSQKEKYVSILNRISNNEWLTTDHEDENENIQIGTCTIKLNDIYKKVVL
jgi:Uma2 family endonuclease